MGIDAISFSFSVMLLMIVVHEDFGKDTDASDIAQRPTVTNGIFLYRQVLRVKRIEQRQAVTKLSELSDLKKQIKMVEPMVKKILEILEISKSRVPKNLEASQYDMLSQQDRDSVSLVLENILFLGDAVLRIPDAVHKVLKKEKNARDTVQWAVGYANTTGFLDEIDLLTLDLMSQELNLIPRKEGYVNVFTESYKMQERETQRLLQKEKEKQVKNKQKAKKQRNLMSGPRAGEL
ncbi:coiled-coil domain-containing protein 134-like isoform X1 [Paramacrobiotus metropolitanus]|uniref:coiled-coil domain-containing protein 134-like isoform X1 n=1 Tax=Paramacrobiotus metropolitanus TaxID=2943436 RepID=UPI0024462D91|nr:coiled-coil domain-containing protein 134-like isoform X1 [Paramacrobiotus metropolitanus]